MMPIDWLGVVSHAKSMDSDPFPIVSHPIVRLVPFDLGCYTRATRPACAGKWHVLPAWFLLSFP